MQEMILVCDAYRKDLQHPNEFIRGSTLRFLCKLKEAELLEVNSEYTLSASVLSVCTQAHLMRGRATHSVLSDSFRHETNFHYFPPSPASYAIDPSLFGPSSLVRSAKCGFGHFHHLPQLRAFDSRRARVDRQLPRNGARRFLQTQRLHDAHPR